MRYVYLILIAGVLLMGVDRSARARVVGISTMYRGEIPGFVPAGGGPTPPEPGTEVLAFYEGDYLITPGWEAVSNSAGYYDSGTNRTYIAWIMYPNPAYTTGLKSARITYYDHTAGVWATPRTIGNFRLVDDDHGHPSVTVDAEGYIHVVYGSHVSINPFQHSISKNPNSIEGWRFNKNIVYDGTYPNLITIGSTIYFLYRNDADPSRRPLTFRTATPSGGDATFSGLSNLVDFGADSRFYLDSAQLRNSTEIHLIATRADAADTERRNVYYFIYDTVSGAVENYNKTASTASLPVSLAAANSDYRIFEHAAGSAGGVVGLQFDSSDRPHVLFIDGLTSGTEYSLEHMYLDTGVWTSPESVATLTDKSPTTGYVDTVGVSADGADIWAIYQDSGTGDAVRRVWSGGTWAPVEVLVASTGRPLGRFIAPKNSVAGLRCLIAEIVEGWSTDADALKSELWLAGDGSIVDDIDLSSGDPNFDTVTFLAGFDNPAGVTATQDESYGNHFSRSFNGNASVSDAQARFGDTSLFLDGTNSYVEFGVLGESNAEFNIVGDFTLEAFVFIAGSGERVIVSKREGAGGNGQYQFFIDASDLLSMAVWDSGLNFIGVTGVTPLTPGQWHHVAFSREGTTGRVFLDGNLENSVAIPSVAPSDSFFTVGRDVNSGTRYFNGYIQELRLTQDVARYTANFTAPVARFPRIPAGT